MLKTREKNVSVVREVILFPFELMADIFISYYNHKLTLNS